MIAPPSLTTWRARAGLSCLTLTLSLLLAAGCSKSSEDDKDKEGADMGAAEKTEALSELEPGDEEPTITAADLQPTFKEFGGRDLVPDRLIIQTQAELVDDTSEDVNLTFNQISFDPETEGRLTRRSKKALTFYPASDSFRPGQTYQVELRSVRAQGQTVRPEQPWTYSFESPAFKLLNMSTPIRLDQDDVEVELIFSAEPDRAALKNLANWTYRGEPVGLTTYKRGSGAHIVRAQLTSEDFGREPGGQLELTLSPGLPWAQDGQIQAEQASIKKEVVSGPEVDIRKVYKHEGTSGYYLQVVCHDEAVPGGERYYYDRRIYESFRVSTQCMPTPAAARQYIDIHPKVDFEISPSRGGFRIFGDFDRGDYAVSIRPGLRTKAGGILRVGYEETITIPERSPTVNFVTKGRYIPKEAWSEVAVRHLNVEELELRVRHIPYDNLVFWMSGSDHDASQRVSNVVANETLPVQHPQDKAHTSWIDIRKIVPDPAPGVYELEIEEVKKEGRGERDESRLLITDLHLVAKRHAEGPEDEWSREVYVWAFGMRDIQPKPGVEVRAIRPSGEALATCQTDAKGGCLLELPPKDIDPAEPFALIANKGEDFTYLKYSELKTELPEATHGQAYLSDQTYQGVVYGDRDLYRPGETARFVVMLREDRTKMAPKKGTPVEIQVRDPRSRVTSREILRTNAAGVVTLEEALGDYAPTGRWRLEAKVGKKSVASYGFGVEEFVPERMRVEAELAQPGYLVGEEMTVDVEAKYLFGGSAQGSRVDVRCWLNPSSFKPPKNRDYHYGRLSWLHDVDSVDLGTNSATIDAQDTAQVSCPSDGEFKGFDVSGTIRAQVSVFEAGSGRVTTESAMGPVHPARHYVGLKAQAKKAQAGTPFTIKGKLVDWQGQGVGAVDQLELEFVRTVSEYGWYYDEDYGRERYRWYKRPVTEGTQTVQVNQDGSFEAKLTPREDGASFIVRATAGEAVTELELPGTRRRYYWWSRSSSTNSTPSPEEPAEVPIEAPEAVDLGEAFEATFEAPFKGRALLTLETHELLAQEWVDVEPGQNTWSTQIDEFVPNAYVSVMIIKDPHLDSQTAFLPGRAIGVQSVEVRPQRYTQSVTLDTPKEVRSQATLKVELELGELEEDTWATVAVVDEGILSLTNFRTPDPNSELFARRALGVDTFDTVGWALQLEQMRGKSGGGYESELGGEESKGLGRVQAIKPVALWSGLVEIPKSGKKTLEFDLPLYRGALRVMAITTSKSRVGRAEAEVLVRDPINIQTTLPRFMTAGDEVHIPVFINNMSGKARDVRVAFSASEKPLEGMSSADLPDSPLVELISKPQKVLSLKDGASGTAIFRVKALRQAGTATFEVTAAAGDLSSRDEAIVPFIPSGPRETKVTRVDVQEGSTDLTGALTGWVPTSERSTFWLTPIPYGEAFDHLKYLIRYPYGCIEQTTSSTRPLLFVDDIVELVDPTIAKKKDEIDRMVRHGIRRVLSMQTSSGGFAYWPGDRSPNSWGTAYATHMLMDAKAQGYEVPQRRLDGAIDWLEEHVGRDSYEHAEPYMHYVLARAGRGHQARIHDLLDTLGEDPAGEKAERAYLLKAALYLLGDHRHEAELKDPDTSAMTDTRHYGSSYYSDRRRRAMTLAVFHDLFDRDPAGEPLAQLVGRTMTQRRSYWYTTQELAWSVTALGKWVQSSSAGFEGAQLKVNGEVLEPQTRSTKRPDVTWALLRASEYDRVTLEVDGKKEGKLYLVVSSEGVRTNPSAEWGGEGLKLERAYFDVDGEPLDASSIELGDVIYSRVTLTNNTYDTIQNVALVERFPAGWEIENPNLGRGQIPEKLRDDLWSTDHMNRRDDRVEVFGTLYSKKDASIVVALRATSAGSFKVPPATAEAMYDPSKWARLEGEQVTILGPWGDATP